MEALDGSLAAGSSRSWNLRRLRVSAGAEFTSRSQSDQAMGLSVSVADQNTTPDNMPMTGPGGILATFGQSSFTPITDFAVSCSLRVPQFKAAGLTIGDDVGISSNYNRAICQLYSLLL